MARGFGAGDLDSQVPCSVPLVEDLVDGDFVRSRGQEELAWHPQDRGADHRPRIPPPKALT